MAVRVAAAASGAARVLAAAGALVLLAPGGCASEPPAAAPSASSTSSTTSATASAGVLSEGAVRFLQANKLTGRVALIQFAPAGNALGDLVYGRMIEVQRDKLVPDLACVRVEEPKDAKAAATPTAVATSTAVAAPATVAAPAAVAPPAGFVLTKDADGSLAAGFGVAALPSVVLVDKFGHARYRGPFPDGDKLIDWTETLAHEKADPGAEAPAIGVSAAAAKALLGATKLPDLAGATKPLGEYHGKGGLMVLFVDTTCPFSGTAIGDVTAVAKVLGDQGIATVLVNLADKEDAVKKFYAARALGVPVVYDVTKATQKAWQVTMVPTVCVFDADGTLLYRGNAVWKDLGSAADGILKLPAGSVNFTQAGTGLG
jgi:hypothetical protein